MTDHHVTLDQTELAVRIIEAMFEIKRPDPDPYPVLAGLPIEASSRALRAAEAASAYLTERLRAGGADVTESEGPPPFSLRSH